MTLRVLIHEVRGLISSALTSAGYPVIEFDVSEPPQQAFGDLSCNVAFLLSKHLKKPPPKIAIELAEVLRQRIQGSSYILSMDPAGGYINFKANYALLSPAILSYVLSNPENYGYPNFGQDMHIIIEHTSVNPNKALHVGHMRNVIIGDTLYRIMRATNHRTTVLNYIDDSGVQIADIVVGFKFAGFPIAQPTKNQKFDQYCGDEVYVKINEMYEKDPQVAEKRKLVLKEIEEGKSEIARFAMDITLRVLQEQLKTCWRMKAHYDLLNFETHIVGSKLWSKTFELLKSNGIAKYETEGKNKGCWVIESKGKKEEDKVLVRSDGTATYIAKDIPYAAWKLGLVEDPFYYQEYTKQWDGSTLYATTLADGSSSGNKSVDKKFNGGERVITIIDSRQSRLQGIISEVLSKIGVSGGNGYKYFHLSYEAVTLSSDTAKEFGIDIGDRQFMHMSGRKGIYVNADYVLDALHAKAYKEAKTRNPDFSDQQLNKIADEISISAIRYNMIKQDLDKIITFDIKESLSLEGDTGPYLQYAYARSQRILEKSEQGIIIATGRTNFAFEQLTHESEIALIKEISKLDLVVENAAKSLCLKSLAHYAYNLAMTFNLFYEKVPVLREQDNEVRMARLGLVKAFGITLKNTLEVLGITALDRM
ncbi:MAG: arginine--tRNA ligase [Thermoproteota archaeon]|nr:arginine--tRNA ligase [Thermoproteota archaeon]